MSDERPLILIVEDEPQIRRFVCAALEDEGRVVEAGSAAAALEAFTGPAPALAIIDLGLPDRDGVELIRELRGWNPLPILVLSARLAEAEKVAALDAGADDYITKPFVPRELLARVRAVVRRHRGEAGPPARELRVGELVVQIGSRRATFRGKDLGLTTYEFDLLFALAQRAGRVLSREQLLELIRGNAEDAFDRSIDVHVSRLRGKLGEAGALVRTVRGAGYMLADSP